MPLVIVTTGKIQSETAAMSQGKASRISIVTINIDIFGDQQDQFPNNI